jgi:POT family proton-dependent oligopeptide transporter
MGYLLVPFSVAATILLVFVAFQQEKQARDKMITAIVLIVFSAFFWAFYEQGGGSLNLYASRNVDMLGMSSAAINNAINPFYIFTLTFPVAWLMLRLAKKQQEPTTPAKFAISFLLLGIGFYVFVTGGKFANEGMVNLFYFAAGYLMITLGELFLSPIGLSMVTKLSPEKFTGMMMGYWFLASAMGQYLAGVIGTLMSIPHGEGGAVDAISALGVYSSVFQKICLVSLVFGVVLFLLVPMLRKWMHDVK